MLIVYILACHFTYFFPFCSPSPCLDEKTENATTAIQPYFSGMGSSIFPHFYFSLKFKVVDFVGVFFSQFFNCTQTEKQQKINLKKRE